MILNEKMNESNKMENFIEQHWSVIESYFKNCHLEQLVRHQLESYNDFVNYQITKTIDMFNPVIIKSENDYDQKSDKYKLEIYIKHPLYDPRPLTMASGAEKTLASMAIRLGLITITNLPKSTIFILDEPATALDAEHMAGFISLLDMIKDQFKTVLLISHLESLKDVVDMTIDIDKNDGYAKVDLK